MDAITTEDILKILQPIWTTKTETAKRLQGRIENILAALTRLEGNPYLFPGSRHGRPLSNMALLQLMRGMGFGVNGNRGEYVPHGFRSSFRDWPGEISSFPRDVEEMALAHAIKNKVEAAYRRGNLFEKRRKMMQEWADYLDNLEVES